MGRPAVVTDARLLEIVRASLARSQPVRLRVFGNSMQPTLTNGATVEIHPAKSDRPLVVGDVVALDCGRDRLDEFPGRVDVLGSELLFEWALAIAGYALVCATRQRRGHAHGRAKTRAQALRVPSLSLPASAHCSHRPAPL